MGVTQPDANGRFHTSRRQQPDTNILTELVRFCQSEVSSKITWLTLTKDYILAVPLLDQICWRRIHN